jgi:Uma2 family endonuclease
MNDVLTAEPLPPDVEAMIREVESVELVSEDGENLETDWHVRNINLLIEVVTCHLHGRTDFYVGGNMFIYFNLEQARNRDFRGPDFFFVWGASLEPMRPHWAVWHEGGHYPDVIIELLSPRTASEDRGPKKKVYETIFHTSDYFCYDPQAKGLDGWHLVDGGYQTLPSSERGWLWCEQLALWLGTWEGKYQEHQATWLRFYTPDGKVVPTFAEAEQQRADAAEAELARLRAQLGQKANGPAGSTEPGA